MCLCCAVDAESGGNDVIDDAERRDDVSAATATSSDDADGGRRAALLAAGSRPVASLVGLHRLRLRQQLDGQPDLPRRRHLLPAAAAARRPADRPAAVRHAVSRLVRPPALSSPAKCSLLTPSASRQHRRLQERTPLRLRRFYHSPVTRELFCRRTDTFITRRRLILCIFRRGALVFLENTLIFCHFQGLIVLIVLLIVSPRIVPVKSQLF